MEAEHESYKAQSVAAQAEYSACELMPPPLFPSISHFCPRCPSPHTLNNGSTLQHATVVGKYQQELRRHDEELKTARRDAAADVKRMSEEQQRRVIELQKGIASQAEAARARAAEHEAALRQKQESLLALGQAQAQSKAQVDALQGTVGQLRAQHTQAKAEAEQRAQQLKQEWEAKAAQDLANLREKHALEVDAAKAAAAPPPGTGNSANDPYANAQPTSSPWGGGLCPTILPCTTITMPCTPCSWVVTPCTP